MNIIILKKSFILLIFLINSSCLIKNVANHKKQKENKCASVNKNDYCVTIQFAGGRLGNQLFEVAAALSIAKENNCKAVFPMFTNEYHWKDMYTYGFDPKKLFIDYINDEDNAIFSKQRLGQWRDESDLRCFEQHNVFPEKINIRREDYSKLNLPLLLKTPTAMRQFLSTYLRMPAWGAFNYFSYKIFDHNKKYIQETFGPTIKQRKALVLKFKKYGLNIENKTTCAIHIRRGDRLSWISQIGFPAAPISYFVKAINLMRQKAKEKGKPIDTFVIFSDSPKQIKNDLLLEQNQGWQENFFFVDFRAHKQKDYEDLWFMSMMDHQIISNSTFSWWAAYLNENSNKIIIEPEHWWFKRKQEFGHHYDPNEMSPPSWIAIDDF